MFLPPNSRANVAVHFAFHQIELSSFSIPLVKSTILKRNSSSLIPRRSFKKLTSLAAELA
jgi:hypothetical protein